MREIIKNKKFLSIFIVFFLFLFLFTFWAGAQSPGCMRDCNECDPAGCTARADRCVWDGNEGKCCRKLEIDWPKSPMGTQINGCTSLPMMIKYFYEWGILLGGLAVFVALIIAGFQYLTSIGDPGKMAEARSKIVSAILGLVLILSSWLILNTINPALTTFRNITFNPQDIDDVFGEFTSGETEPCEFAFVYKNKDYDTSGGVVTLPYRKWIATLTPPDFGYWTTRYVFESGFKSVSCFVQCEPCDPCSDEEVEGEEDLPADEKKCIDPDGDGVFHNKEICEDPVPVDGVYYKIEDECKQELISGLGIMEECNSLFDCEAYYREGGACTLQLSGGRAFWEFWAEYCRDRIGETYAKHPNLGALTDRNIDCVKLIKHESEKFQ